MNMDKEDVRCAEVPEHEKRFRQRMMRHQMRAELAEKILLAAYGGQAYPSPSDAWYKADELLRIIESEEESIKAALVAETP